MGEKQVLEPFTISAVWFYIFILFNLSLNFCENITLFQPWYENKKNEFVSISGLERKGEHIHEVQIICKKGKLKWAIFKNEVKLQEERLQKGIYCYIFFLFSLLKRFISWRRWILISIYCLQGTVLCTFMCYITKNDPVWKNIIAIYTMRKTEAQREQLGFPRSQVHEGAGERV